MARKLDNTFVIGVEAPGLEQGEPDAAPDRPGQKSPLAAGEEPSAPQRPARRGRRLRPAMAAAAIAIALALAALAIGRPWASAGESPSSFRPAKKAPGPHVVTSMTEGPPRRAAGVVSSRVKPNARHRRSRHRQRRSRRPRRSDTPKASEAKPVAPPPAPAPAPPSPIAEAPVAATAPSVHAPPPPRPEFGIER